MYGFFHIIVVDDHIKIILKIWFYPRSGALFGQHVKFKRSFLAIYRGGGGGGLESTTAGPEMVKKITLALNSLRFVRCPVVCSAVLFDA